YLTKMIVDLLRLTQSNYPPKHNPPIQSPAIQCRGFIFTMLPPAPPIIMPMPIIMPLVAIWQA
ncbi:hypothetical protein, partial [Moraxella catarrhalis]|uniref:hypothetical protein n=1 Tax=Moraxella catarrhalis TaxID=480 RepID=UPI001D0D96F6